MSVSGLNSSEVREYVPKVPKRGRPAEYTSEHKAQFLEIFALGGTETAAINTVGANLGVLENWKNRDKAFLVKFRVAMKTNLLAYQNLLEEIVTTGDMKQLARAGYFTNIIKRRQNYLSKTSINVNKMSPAERLHSIRERLAADDTEYRHTKDEIALAESEHKMNLDGIAERLEKLENQQKEDK